MLLAGESLPYCRLSHRVSRDSCSLQPHPNQWQLLPKLPLALSHSKDFWYGDSDPESPTLSLSPVLGPRAQCLNHACDGSIGTRHDARWRCLALMGASIMDATLLLTIRATYLDHRSSATLEQHRPRYKRQMIQVTRLIGFCSS